MSSTPKLTKRQRKGIAFRELRSGKGKAKKLDDLDHDVPILEVQDLTDSRASGAEGGEDVQDAQGIAGGKGKGREKVVVQKEGEKKGLVVATKKRKREEAAEDTQGAGEGEREDSQSGKQKVKRRKGDAGDILEGAEEAEEGETKIEKSKQRFILFLGNLKYITTIEAIQAHFAACDPPPTVRLLAPKPAANKPSSKPVIKSKGCAFLEFKHRNALQQGLKLHHSSLDGRQINVELTAGGGGKGEARLSKLKERNKELESQRHKRLQKTAKSQGEAPVPDTEGAKKRFSTTSGTDQEVQNRRTWTVGDAEESTTHRGGKKHAKGGKARRPNIKDWGTGVNAIPVG
ncbi:hypothetical protein M405DRAFT_743448 [Rhizopogon salebrosus TDB-379]|nr:hypothetical protein M405DRAFT_743448 [Rhizopogon salebrosus TDB-379]